DVSERNALPLAPGIDAPRQAQREAAGTYTQRSKPDPVEMGTDAERAAADIVGLQTDQRQSQKHGDESCQQRIFEKCRPSDQRPSGIVDGKPGGGRHQTFSTSGRPSSPVGQKTRTRMRTTKTETSLYSTEK